MRKGFFLTESEKNRISNLYGGNKLFLLEATTPPPNTKEERVEFSKWMDDKYGEWVSLSGGRKSKSPGTWAQSKPFQSTSWQNAWDKYGDEYTQEKKGNKPGTGGVTTQEAKEFWYDSQSPKGPKTKQEILDLFSAGSITVNTKIYHTGNPSLTKGEWVLGGYVEGLGLPKPYNQQTTGSSRVSYNQYKSGGSEFKLNDLYAGASGNTTQEVKASFEQSAREALFDAGIGRQASDEGFIQWYQQMYGIELDKEENLPQGYDPKSKRIEVVDPSGNKKYFYYDESQQKWKLPDLKGGIRIGKPGITQGLD